MEGIHAGLEDGTTWAGTEPQSISEMMDKRDGVMQDMGSKLNGPLHKRELELQGIVAQAWCSAENEHKEMDPTLACEIARLVYLDEEMQLDLAEDQVNLGCATTGELLAEIEARCSGTLDYRTVGND